MPILIQNARLVTATSDTPGDLYAEGESITTLAAPGSLSPADLPADTTVIDAAGKLLMPGFIDPHVHIHLPFMGTFAKDDHATASRAALVGGTTTYLEMICPSRDEEPLEAYQLWNGKASAGVCDYGFHVGVTRFDDSVEQQLRTLVADHGQRSFKVFLAYKGAFGVTDDELYNVCKLAQELGVTVTAHCENAELVAANQAALLAAGKTGPEWHEPSRPVSVETEGVHHFCTFLELTGATGYIVHTSCREAVEIAMDFRARGVDVAVETVIPYLTLDDTYAQRGTDTGHAPFEGAKYVMSPPIRSADHRDYLWHALAAGHVHTLGTDHAPFDFATQKHMGCPDPAKAVDAAFNPINQASDFTKIPNGIPSIQHRADLLFQGVADGRITLQQFVALASTNAADLFGLRTKGHIAPGYDADLVLYDPDAPKTISAATHHMATDYSGFEGVTHPGHATHVFLRGSAAVVDGQLVDDLPPGQAAPRS
ncbi:MAG: dihydropyrimidinase [Planctomycetota bacterium]